MDSFKEIKELFNFSIPEIINSIVLDNSQEIIELNQIEQLQEGVDALDQRIKTISAEEQGAGNVYGFRSIAERSAAGLQTDNVDLKITGALWASAKVVKVSKGWDIKYDWTIHGEDVRDHFDSKYDFAGLTPGNTEVFVYDTIIPELHKRVRAKLNV